MSRTPSDRFWSKVDKTGDCWTWQASRKRSGYGQFWDGTRVRPAHRYVYEMIVGPIPEGLQIDHLCRNRACVNPEHLEPVTPRENVVRGETLPAGNTRKTHCPSGHPYDRISPTGTHRYCSICKRAAEVRRQRVCQACGGPCSRRASICRRCHGR